MHRSVSRTCSRPRTPRDGCGSSRKAPRVAALARGLAPTLRLVRGVGVLDDLALGLAHGPLHFLNSSLKIVHRRDHHGSGRMVGRGVPPSRRVGRIARCGRDGA